MINTNKVLKKSVSVTLKDQMRSDEAVLCFLGFRVHLVRNFKVNVVRNAVVSR